MATVVDSLKRATDGINAIESALRTVGAIGQSEEIPIEDFSTRILNMSQSSYRVIATSSSNATYRNQLEELYDYVDALSQEDLVKSGLIVDMVETTVTPNIPMVAVFRFDNVKSSDGEYDYSNINGTLQLFKNTVIKFMGNHNHTLLDVKIDDSGTISFVQKYGVVNTGVIKLVTF